MSKKNTFDLIRGYTQGANDTSGKKFYVQVVSGSANRVTLTRFGKYFTGISHWITKVLSYTQSRTYGAFLLAFGAFSLVAHLVRGYLGLNDSVPLYVLICCSVIALLAIPFLISDKPLSIAVQDFPLTDYIFFEFFCIRRMHRNYKEKGVHLLVGLFLGVLLAVLGTLVPFWYVLASIGVCVYLFLTFLSPEFSFFSIFLVMPYLSFDSEGIFLAAMVAVTLLSYARKVSSGKRVYYFEQYDLALLLMLFCILISGIFVKGVESFVSSVVMILLGAGYMLSSSLVTNRRLADCLINAVIISSLPVSVIAIVESVIEISTSGIAGFAGASATFDKPYTLAIFLLVSGAFSLYFVTVRHRKSAIALYTVIFLITLAALFFTMSFWAFSAALIGAIVFTSLKLKRGSTLVILAFTVLPYCLMFIPSEQIDLLVASPLLEALGFSEAMSAWLGSIEMLKDNLFLGVGIGEECFAEEIAAYLPGYSLENSGSFLLEVACEAGVISLSALLLIFLIRVRHRAIYQPYVKNSQVAKLSDFTTVAMTCLMVYGAFNYVWADMTMYYLFWCVFGLGSAALRVAKQEFDDRVAYFSDGSAEDSSSIDISIK